MKLPRSIGLIDIAIITIAIAAILVPPRRMYASDAAKGTPADRFGLARAEAQLLADPANGMKIGELAERLGAADFKDWAIEAAVAGVARAKDSPTRWRALMAASVAYVEHKQVMPALDYIEQAIAACEAQRPTCASWDQPRMELYRQHLDAGVKSGIDPRKDPVGFRQAGERSIRSVRVAP